MFSTLKKVKILTVAEQSIEVVECMQLSRLKLLRHTIRSTEILSPNTQTDRLFKYLCILKAVHYFPFWNENRAQKETDNINATNQWNYLFIKWNGINVEWKPFFINRHAFGSIPICCCCCKNRVQCFSNIAFYTERLFPTALTANFI